MQLPAVVAVHIGQHIFCRFAGGLRAVLPEGDDAGSEVRMLHEAAFQRAGELTVPAPSCRRRASTARWG